MRHIILLGLLITGSAFATGVQPLQSRDIDGNGSIDAYYDPNLNVTWLKNVHLEKTETFGVPLPSLQLTNTGHPNMSYYDAEAWIAGMNSHNGAGYFGYNDWRLPTGEPGANCQLTSTDPDDLCYLGEMGYFGRAYNDALPLFDGMVSGQYWTTTNLTNPDYTYSVNASRGYLGYAPKYANLFTVVVKNGDVVPVPAAIWLLGSALAGLGFLRKRSTV